MVVAGEKAITQFVPKQEHMRIAKSRDGSHERRRPTLVGLDLHFHNLLQPWPTQVCFWRAIFVQCSKFPPGFFKGTSADQDRRFSDKEMKLLKATKFPPEFDKKVRSLRCLRRIQTTN